MRHVLLDHVRAFTTFFIIISERVLSTLKKEFYLKLAASQQPRGAGGPHAPHAPRAPPHPASPAHDSLCRSVRHGPSAPQIRRPCVSRRPRPAIGLETVLKEIRDHEGGASAAGVARQAGRPVRHGYDRAG